MMNKALLLIAGLLLSGCEIMMANSIQDYHDTRALVRAYVAENVAVRRDIRRYCHDIVMRQVEALQGERKFVEALEVLARAYPPLLTTEIVEKKLAALDDAPVCR